MTRTSGPARAGGVLIGGLLLLIGLVLLFTLIGALFGVVLMGAGLSLMLLSAL
jgi:hypothetical protein